MEAVSPSDTATHLKSKVEAYLQGEAKTVWVVFPDARSVMIHSGESVRELKGDWKIEEPLLPGFPRRPLASSISLDRSRPVTG